VAQLEARKDGSADLLAYFVRQVEEVTGEQIPIVVWGQIDDDEGERYLAQVEFARSLRRALGSPALWPTVLLSAEQTRKCPGAWRGSLRPARGCAAFRLGVPGRAQAAGHPRAARARQPGALGQRADPVATMGFATLMVLLTLAVMVLFVIDTPWVPG